VAAIFPKRFKIRLAAIIAPLLTANCDPVHSLIFDSR